MPQRAVFGRHLLLTQDHDAVVTDGLLDQRPRLAGRYLGLGRRWTGTTSRPRQCGQLVGQAG